MEALCEMDVLDTTGHTKHSWDPKNTDEVKAVEVLFNQLQKKGYKAFRVKKFGRQGDELREFDPTATQMIMVPPISGG